MWFLIPKNPLNPRFINPGSTVFLLTRLISEASYVACPRVRPHDTPIFLQAESNVSGRVPVVSVGLLIQLFEGLTINKLTVS